MCLCEWVIASYCHLYATQPENSALSLPLLTGTCAPSAHFAGLCTHTCIHTRACTHVTKEKKSLPPKNKHNYVFVFWILWLYLCCCCCWVTSVVSDSVRPHRRQPTRLPRPWDSPGKSTGVGCHFLLQCMIVKSESEVAQSCPTLSDPMDCSLPGSSVHGILQARILEWGAIAFSSVSMYYASNLLTETSNTSLKNASFQQSFPDKM